MRDRCVDRQLTIKESLYRLAQVNKEIITTRLQQCRRSRRRLENVHYVKTRTISIGQVDRASEGWDRTGRQVCRA
jgi:hypothetical protein